MEKVSKESSRWGWLPAGFVYFSFFERCVDSVAKRPQTAEWWEGDFQVLETPNSLLGWELGFTRCDNDASMIM